MNNDFFRQANLMVDENRDKSDKRIRTIKRRLCLFSVSKLCHMNTTGFLKLQIALLIYSIELLIWLQYWELIF